MEGNDILRQDEMGNYFVLTVNNNVADCHIQRVRLAAGAGAADALVFSDHFWEFEDERVMYLMFNNYGYSFPNANQLLDGGVNWGTRVKPEPLCFAFRAGDSFARITAHPHHIEMVVRFEHLV